MTLVDLVEKEDHKSAHCLCCGDPISSNVRVCPDCGAPSHGDCWDYIGGCGVMGCSARGTNLDSKMLDQDSSEVAIGDIFLPSAPKPVRNYDNWLARLKSWFSREDKDAWIDSYLDEVRSSLKGVRFTQLSDDVSSHEAIEFCEKKGAVLASAQECAFFSILGDGKDHEYSKYTRTFCFGFRDGGKSLVAYAEVPHEDWLYLMDKIPCRLSKDDPVVSSALDRAVGDGRVVPAKKGVYIWYSCVPGEDRSSDFDRDAHNRAIFQSAAQPFGLMRYRKGLNVDSHPLSSEWVEESPDGQVMIWPLRLDGGVYCGDGIINIVVACDRSFSGSGRVLGAASSQKFSEPDCKR